jgi:hypothetical protein
MLARRVFVEHDEDVRVFVRAQPVAPRGWSAVLRLESPDGQLIGTREITTDEDDCHAFDERLSLVVALMVDLPKTHVSVKLPPRRPSAESARSAISEIETGVGAVLQLGWVPEPLYGVRAFERLRVGSLWPVEAELGWWFPRRIEAQGSSVEVRAWYVGLMACPALVKTALMTLGVCGGGRVGRIDARGASFADNEEASGLLLESHVALELTAPILPPLSLRAAVGATLALTRTRFSFSDEAGRQELFQARQAFGVGQLSALVHFDQ